MSLQAISNDDMLVGSLFKPGHTITWSFLKELEMPWDALPLISSYVSKLGAGLSSSEYDIRPGNVWIHKSATVATSAFIGTNIIIGENADIRHNAYIRTDAIIGKHAVIGNATELKNVILFDNASVPHFNYAGDSILGYKSHFGAGVITSNVKSDYSAVSVNCGNNRFETSLTKFGAIIGDNAEIGCNAVLNPGTIIGAGATVYPLSMVRGFVPANSIYKKQGEVVLKRET